MLALKAGITSAKDGLSVLNLTIRQGGQDRILEGRSNRCSASSRLHQLRNSNYDTLLTFNGVNSTFGRRWDRTSWLRSNGDTVGAP